tara:strand:+ start:30 stop:1121 length:1092 start_codon:yes stop_codon:yes gene_type:complete
MELSMRATREIRLLTDIVEETKYILATQHNFGPDKIQAIRTRIEATGKKFAFGSFMFPIEKLKLDYTVQRDIIIKHCIAIITRYNPQLCAPASSVIDDLNKLDLDNLMNSTALPSIYDGQHRIVCTAILGYTEVPITIVEDPRPSFATYAFEECNTNVKALEPKDFYRNRLTRYALLDRSAEVVLAHICEEAFNYNNVDLEDKSTRNSKNKGDGKHFFSHFKYANEIMKADSSGKLLNNILEAITQVYPNDEEISQDLFIGLAGIHMLDFMNSLPQGWMIDVVEKCAISYPTSKTVTGRSLYREKGDLQKQHTMPGHDWTKGILADFIRELYIYNGGTLNLPSKKGSLMQLDTNPSPYLFTEV